MQKRNKFDELEGGWSSLMVSPCVFVMLSAGCGRNTSPEEAAPDNQKQYDSQIQSIQNNTSMSPEEKHRAIADIKSRQAATKQSR
jgi:hypothetical protein